MSYTCLQYHIVFSTKDRLELLGEEVTPRLRQYFGGITRELQGKLIAVNGPANHVHLLVSLSPKLALMDYIGKIKANSSKWVHNTFGQLGNFAWQDGYAAFTVSPSGTAQVINYIQNQNEHHKQMSFQEELIALLKRHQIDYDEKYITT